MTKLERAKRQSLLDWWEYVHINLGIFFDGIHTCGFCQQYKTFPLSTPPCKLCPVFQVEKQRCTETDWYEEVKQSTEGCLAVMVYIHGFTETDTRVLVGRQRGGEDCLRSGIKKRKIGRKNVFFCRSTKNQSWRLIYLRQKTTQGALPPFNINDGLEMQD